MIANGTSPAGFNSESTLPVAVSLAMATKILLGLFPIHTALDMIARQTLNASSIPFNLERATTSQGVLPLLDNRFDLGGQETLPEWTTPNRAIRRTWQASSG